MKSGNQHVTDTQMQPDARFGNLHSVLNSYYVNETISKHKINKLVLKYFIQEGFQNAALSFSKEAGINLNSKPSENAPPKTSDALLLVAAANLDLVDFVQAVKNYAQLKAQTFEKSAATRENSGAAAESVMGYSSIEKRKAIKYLILKGDITQAIHLVSMHFPTVLDCNNLLLFKLLRLNLIEMIRDHKLHAERLKEADNNAERQFLDDILLFVRENLISKVTHSHELLKELEMTMSLLCFNFDPRKPIDEMHELPEELKQLFDLSLRTECYRVVNRAILDLENSNLDIQQYKGITYTEFSPSMLQSLPAAPLLGSQEDVEMVDAERTTPTDLGVRLEDLVALANNPGKVQEPTATLATEDEAAIEPAALESQLERIAILWIATEHRLFEKKLIPAKRYGIERSNGKVSL